MNKRKKVGEDKKIIYWSLIITLSIHSILESVISLLPADSCCFQGLSIEIISLSRKKFNINANEEPN